MASCIKMQNDVAACSRMLQRDMLPPVRACCCRKCCRRFKHFVARQFARQFAGHFKSFLALSLLSLEHF